MIIVLIKKNLIKIKIIITLALLCIIIGYNFFAYNQIIVNSLLKNKTSAKETYESGLHAFLYIDNDFDDERIFIEVFDIAKGEVILKAESNESIQKEARNFLDSISGMVVKVKAFPEKGRIIKIPLGTSVYIENQYLNSLVNEIFLILPEQGRPYLMVLDYKGRPEFFNFETNPEKFLSLIQYPS